MPEPTLEQKDLSKSHSTMQLTVVHLLEQISRRDQRIAMATEDTQRQKREISLQAARIAGLENAARIAGLENAARIAGLEQAARILNAQYSEKEQKLAEITNSKAWKIVLFFRGIRERMLPIGSPQGRFARYLLQGLKNIYHKLKRLARLAQKTREFLAVNGAGKTLLKIVDWIKFILTKKKRNYRSVLINKFPQKFNTHGSPFFTSKKWKDEVDSAALAALREVLTHMKMSVSESNLLDALKAAFAEDKYYQMLEDLFSFEQFITAEPHENPVFEIIQTAQLPKHAEPTRRRRILFVTSQFPNPYNGGGNRVLNFIKILSQNNDIYLSTCFIPNEDGPELSKIEPYCRSIQTIPYWQFGENQSMIREWLQGVHMDIVHYEWPRSLENYDPAYGQVQIFTYMESVSLRLKMDMDKMQLLSQPWLEKFVQLAYALRLELADAAQLTARIAVTTRDADFFKDIYPRQKYAVLNHGLTFDEFSLEDVEPEPDTLVFVGNYRHYPNMDAMEFFFDEIWPAICQEIPGVRIYLVGPNLPEKLTRLADGQRIITTGGVPDIRPYLQKASIGIAPLITGAGMRGKVIDYAAMRRTFVATSLAVTDLVFENGVDFFCADNAPEFSQKIITLLKDQAMARKMSSSAFNTARQNYDNNRLTEFLVRFYDYLEE